MKKSVVIGAIALLFSFNAQAFEINPYASGKVDFNLHKSKPEGESKIKDNTFGGSIAVGVSGDEALPLRTEFEFSMSAKAKDKIDGESVGIKTNSYMANFYYDFYNNSGFIPYAGFGLGATTAKVSTDESVSKTNFAWQIGLGSYYKLNESLLADLGVRYNKTSFSGKLDMDTDITTVSLGLRYNF